MDGQTAVSMLPDLRQGLADWLALVVFGHDNDNGTTCYTLNGVTLSRRSFALLFASTELLMALFDAYQRT